MCSYREKKSEPQELLQLDGYTVDYTDPQPGNTLTFTDYSDLPLLNETILNFWLLNIKGMCPYKCKKNYIFVYTCVHLRGTDYI